MRHNKSIKLEFETASSHISSLAVSVYFPIHKFVGLRHFSKQYNCCLIILNTYGTPILFAESDSDTSCQLEAMPYGPTINKKDIMRKVNPNLNAFHPILNLLPSSP